MHPIIVDGVDGVDGGLIEHFGFTVKTLERLGISAIAIEDKEVYSIPAILFLTWRGEPGVKDEPQHRKMGTLATIGHYKPKNLVHIIIDNGAYESTGNQPTVSKILSWKRLLGRPTSGPIENKKDFMEFLKASN